MKLTQAEKREIRSGRPITRRILYKPTGEEMWIEVTTMWNKRYYRVEDGQWKRTITESLNSRP